MKQTASIGRTQRKQKEDGVDKEYNYCLRCGRRLKNPVARKCGYGVICLEKVKQNTSVNKLF